MDIERKAILVVGAGDHTGAAIARRFAQGGCIACISRRHGDKLAPLAEQIRTSGREVHSFGSDARREDQVIALIDKIEREIAPLEVCVYNVGGNVRFPLGETTSRVYFKVWEMCAFGAFLVGREAAKHMVPRRRGTILFTGATASLRGAAGYAAFAGGKHAKRALAQSMARELGPLGIHVAHIVIDGAIDTAFIRENRPEIYNERKEADGLLDPEAIAEAFWQIHSQPRSAWTFETDLRPWSETW